jgi:hypothetical protein
MSMFFSGNSIITAGNISAPTIATISLWVYPTLLGSTNRRIFGSHDSYEIRILANRVIYADINAAGGFSMGTITVNNLYNIIIRYNRSTGNIEAWINGSMVGSATNQTTNPSNAAMSFGTRTGTTDYYYGYMDDFRIYDRWITDNEIESIYNSKGCDSIYYGLRNRWLFLEGGEGANIPIGTGVIKDYIGNLNCSRGNGMI